MSITKISIFICNWMNKINYRDEEENRVIQYGLELLLDSIIKFILIFLIGIIVGKWKETLIILLSFCGLRLQSGGKHAKTGIGCSLSMIMIWGSSLLLDMFLIIEFVPLLFIYIICSIVVVYSAPKTKNIQYFSIKEKHRKKFFAFSYLTLLFVFAVVIPSIRGVIIYPVILEVLTLLPKNK